MACREEERRSNIGSISRLFDAATGHFGQTAQGHPGGFHLEPECTWKGIQPSQRAFWPDMFATRMPFQVQYMAPDPGTRGMIARLPRPAAILAILAIGAAASAAPAAAQDTLEAQATQEAQVEQGAQDTDAVNLEFSAGIFHDSRVAIEETDGEPAAKPDFALTLGASANYRKDVGNGAIVSLAYSAQQSLYRENPEFDLTVHGLNAGYSHARGAAAFQASYSYNRAMVAGGHFLDLHLASAAYARVVARGLTLRITPALTVKNYADADDYDANNLKFTGTAEYRLPGKRNFFTALAGLEMEDARADALDHHSFHIAAALRLGADRLGMGAMARFNVNLAQRNYRSISPQIGEKRTEARLVLATSLTLPVADHLSLRGQLRHTARNSNFARANYQEQYGALGAIARF